MQYNTSMALGKKQLVDSIWKSTGIEGLGTSFPSTKAILENLPVTTKRDEVYFVCNMKRAWEFLFENIDYPVNLMYLRELNKICMENLPCSENGKIRTVPVSIGGTDWKPSIPNTNEIAEDIQKIMENPDKVDAALDLFCYTARRQIFLDGNKRVSQLIANKILMENDLGILSIPYSKITDFVNKLVRYYETNDSKELKSFLKEYCLTLVNVKDKKDEVEEKEIEEFEK